MRLPIVALPLLATGLSAQLTCTVDDVRSHGALGDTRLSLDEAIRVVNGTLALTALSTQERARFSGIGSILEEIRLDPAVTPTVTLERVLTDVVGQHHAHVHVSLLGVTGTAAGHVVLDAGNHAVGLPVRTNHAHIHGLEIRGGQIGIDFDTSQHYHPSEFAELGEIHCEGQSSVGIRVTNNASPSGEQAPLVLHEVHVHDAPIGLQIRDLSTFGNVDVSAEHLAIEDCAVGIDVDIQSTGGDHLLDLTHAEIRQATHGVRVRRTAASTARWQLRFLHVDVDAMQRAFDVEANTPGTTALGLHHVVASGGVLPGDFALRTAPRAGTCTLRVTETLLAGDIGVALAPGANGLVIGNSRLRNGAASFDLGNGNGLLQWNTFTSIPLQVLATNAGTLNLDGSELVRSPLTNLAPGAVLLSGCFLASSPTSGPVTAQNALTAPWIGRATVSPIDPPLGGFVDLSVDLPAGIAALWILGVADANPNVFASPFRFYFDLTSFVTLPGIATGQARTRVPVPMNMSLRGRGFYGQPVQAPIASQPFVPPLFLPIGGSFEIGS